VEEEIVSHGQGAAVRSFDPDKTMWELIPAEALELVVQVYNHGAKKYGDPRNWEKGMPFSRMFASAMRHLWKWWRGEDLDPDSGCHHLAMSAWNVIGLLHYAVHSRYRQWDDRRNDA